MFPEYENEGALSDELNDSTELPEVENNFEMPEPDQSELIDEIPEDVPLEECEALDMQAEQLESFEEIPEDIAAEDEAWDTQTEQPESFDEIPEDIAAEDEVWDTQPEQPESLDEIPEDIEAEDEVWDTQPEQPESFDEMPDDVPLEESEASDGSPVLNDSAHDYPQNENAEETNPETQTESDNPYSFHFPGYETHEFPEVDNPKVLKPDHGLPPYEQELQDNNNYFENSDSLSTAELMDNPQAQIESRINEIYNNQLSPDGKIEALNALKDELQGLKDPSSFAADDTYLQVETNSEVPDVHDVSDWIGEINPNFDEFDPESPYCNNCGSCAFAVYQRLEGNPNSCASAENIGYNSEMEALTGMEQISMSPEEIQNALLEQGDGAHAIIGIDRAEGPGHWFNAACIDGKVVAIDGQSGEVMDWPPDYGDVVNWEMSVKKENE